MNSNLAKYSVVSFSVPEVLLEKQPAKESDIYSLGTPDIYIKLVKQCMDNNPIKQSSAKEVYEKLQEWEIVLSKEQEELNEEQIKIKKDFLEADKIIPTLSTISRKHHIFVNLLTNLI
ncbi:hypothetical protein C2G38_2158364 [Gigaspora rosea]|uniref:Serine-threonine/tyrosine-protein kinase catalytic domain-containing protein n=1 Tax=Gigaspora rosea TaxID=44941 RepID=A0A397W2J2_9GLOM|nr:hypothetical protein C2G38_2158364 [Gigaspora rosea]